MKKMILILLLITSLYSNTLSEYKEEAMKGNATSAYELALLYETKGDKENALFWYKESARLSIGIKVKDDKEMADESKIIEDILANGSSLEAVKEATKSVVYSERMFRKYIDTYEDNDTKNTVFEMMSSHFGLMPYNSNYLLPATYDFSKFENRKHFETKFQFSFKRDVVKNILGFDNSLGFAYTQRSWWQTNSNSAPFRETNYLPEIYFSAIVKDKDSFLKGYQVGFLHESNGRGDELSKSWNRLYIEGYFQLSGMFFIPRFWYKIPEKGIDDDNPDILKYTGYGSLRIIVPYKKHIFKAMLRNNFSFNNNRGGYQLDWTYPLKENNLFGYLQYYYGYGESLIDYNKKINRVSIGVAFTR